MALSKGLQLITANWRLDLHFFWFLAFFYLILAIISGYSLEWEHTRIFYKSCIFWQQERDSKTGWICLLVFLCQKQFLSSPDSNTCKPSKVPQVGALKWSAEPGNNAFTQTTSGGGWWGCFCFNILLAHYLPKPFLVPNLQVVNGAWEGDWVRCSFLGRQSCWCLLPWWISHWLLLLLLLLLPLLLFFFQTRAAIVSDMVMCPEQKSGAIIILV